MSPFSSKDLRQKQLQGHLERIMADYPEAIIVILLASPDGPKGAQFQVITNTDDAEDVKTICQTQINHMTKDPGTPFRIN